MTSNKDLDLDDLFDAIKTATPVPDPDTRADHIALAEANFAQMQGGSSTAAPSGPRASLLSFFTSLTGKGSLTATTALIASGVLIFTPQGQSIWQPGPILPESTGELGATERDDALGGLPAPAFPVVVQEPPAPSDVLQELNSREEPLPGGADVLLEERANESLVPDAPDMAASEFSTQNDLPHGASVPWPSEGDMEADGFSSMETGEGALRGDMMFDFNPTLGYNDWPGPQDTSTTLTLGLPAEQVARHEGGIETFANADPNPVQITAQTPVSTFSIDVDTAAYALIRQSLMAGALPPTDAVRVEEMINYFPFDYTTPTRDSALPFQPNITVMQTPWNEHTQLVHIGLQAAVADRAPLNLVFLIDTSGSMDDANKLPLLRQSFLLMLDQLQPGDEVAIVAYAGSAGLVLPATPATDRAAIITALNSLDAGGSTNGQGGLEQAYATAQAMMEDGDVSRVILATDGDFNVGLSDPAGLEAFIAAQRDTGTYLSVLGFGRGTLNDALMQTLAQNGNGIAAYIDTLNEAQKVLVDQLSGALFAIANDVKVQIEWNPGIIAEYRLIGYETRALAREDFNNDRVDAGELGSGHSVTAIYEVTPVGSPAVLNDPLRYQAQVATTDNAEMGWLRLRWKEPGSDDSQLYELPILDIASGGTPGTEVQFATAIAGFGQLLRDPTTLGDWGWDDAIALANAGTGDDPFGYRREAVQLMRLAQSLSQN